MGNGNSNYYNLIDKRLPKKLQNLAYILLKKYVEYDEIKKKPVKKPLSGIKWADIKYSWNETYLDRVSEYFKLETRYNKTSRKHYLNNQLNIGLILDFTDLLVIDVDNAENTFKQLEIVSKFTSISNSKAISELLELFNNTFSVTSGNGGFHYYFRLENKPNSKYFTRKTKCLKLNKLLDFGDEQVLKSGLSEDQALDFDLLGTGNIILPPSKFFFKRTENKTVMSDDWEHNEYQIYNDNEILSIDESILDQIFDTSKNSKQNLIKKKVKQIPLLQNNILNLIKDFQTNDINQYSQAMIDELSKDQEASLIYKDYIQTQNPNVLVQFEEKKEIFLKTLLHDNYPYEFFYDQWKTKNCAYNNYSVNKPEVFRAKFLTNLYTSQFTKKYSEKLDRSSFEYGFIKSQLIRNIPIELIWTIIKHDFLGEVKITDRNYFIQLADKVQADMRASNRVSGDRIYHKLTNFSADTQCIDYTYYFKGSASNCAKIFQTIVERALKLASANNIIPKNNFHLNYESMYQISLLSGVSLQTTSRCLKKLESKRFIKIRKKTATLLNEDNEPEIKELIFLGTIEISRDMKFKLIDSSVYTPELLPELSKIKGIGNLGSILFTKLFDSEYSKNLKEIYQLFPNTKNKTTTIKQKLNLLVEYGFVEYNSELKAYKSSELGLSTKLKNAKDTEYKKSMLEFIAKVDPEHIPSDISNYRVTKNFKNGSRLRIPKLKPFNTFSHYSKEYSQNRTYWNEYKNTNYKEEKMRS